MTVKLHWLGWVNLAKDDVINYWLGLIANSFPNMRLKEFKLVVGFATGITVAFLAVQAALCWHLVLALATFRCRGAGDVDGIN